MRRTPKVIGLAVATTVTVLAGTSIVTPAATAATTGDGQSSSSDVEPFSTSGCVMFNTSVITGNWDGVGGDGVGTVTRTTSGKLFWQLRNGPNSGPADYSFFYGANTDVPVVGNWDGIGGDGIGVIGNPDGDNEKDWALRQGPNGGDSEIYFGYGALNDKRIVGNWDGVGGDGPGAVSLAGNWHLRDAPSGGVANYNFAFPAANPTFAAAGNWDGIGGDGPGWADWTDPAGEYIWRLRNGPNGGGAEISFNYGRTSGCPVVGNWDGVGGDGIGVVYLVNGTQGNDLSWRLRNGPNGGPEEFNFAYGKGN
ncbi:hypothetical protein WEI85_47510 [Actinomycetes bacterium KLBMP 9797]